MADIDLEHELQLELAKLDQIFLSSTQDSEDDPRVVNVDTKGMTPVFSFRSASVDFGSPPQARVAFELAEAEIEKEELQDQLRILLSKTEDFDAQLLQLHAENQDLFTRYTQVLRENERLKQEVADTRNERTTSQVLSTPGVSTTPCAPTVSEQDYQALEFKLAETRAKLARFQQHFEDLTLAREVTVKELERERLLRLKAEKERDAYSAAYEMSLKKIDHWAQTKALAKRVFSRAREGAADATAPTASSVTSDASSNNNLESVLVG